jgi:mRNA interferase MazF
MNEGDIALAPLPQTDGQIKNRPVVLLRRLPPFGDFLVCGVSTQLQHRVVGFDEVIAPGEAGFAASGLKAASLIRLGFLAVLPEAALLGRIGTLSAAHRKRLLANLCRHLNSPDQAGQSK